MIARATVDQDRPVLSTRSAHVGRVVMVSQSAQNASCWATAHSEAAESDRSDANASEARTASRKAFCDGARIEPCGTARM
ncbi:MAG: hypothetical protein BGO38_06920 [Cellulomonas sp. 73-145]|nr:MAG: hypothetical protein BGO38_06920 [Cellulomonas sp. 73-145]